MALALRIAPPSRTRQTLPALPWATLQRAIACKWVEYTFSNAIRNLRAGAAAVRLGAQGRLEPWRKRRASAPRGGASHLGRGPAGADAAGAWLFTDQRHTRA